jgi:hypothetical protein
MEPLRLDTLTSVEMVLEAFQATPEVSLWVDQEGRVYLYEDANGKHYLCKPPHIDTYKHRALVQVFKYLAKQQNITSESLSSALLETGCTLTLYPHDLPILSPSGYSYEAAHIWKWLSKNDRDPMTRESCLSTLLLDKALTDIGYLACKGDSQRIQKKIEQLEAQRHSLLQLKYKGIFQYGFQLFIDSGFQALCVLYIGGVLSSLLGCPQLIVPLMVGISILGLIGALSSLSFQNHSFNKLNALSLRDIAAALDTYIAKLERIELKDTQKISGEAESSIKEQDVSSSSTASVSFFKVTSHLNEPNGTQVPYSTLSLLHLK